MPVTSRESSKAIAELMKLFSVQSMTRYDRSIFSNTLVNLFKPENTNQCKLVKDSTSNKVIDFLIN